MTQREFWMGFVDVDNPIDCQWAGILCPSEAIGGVESHLDIWVHKDELAFLVPRNTGNEFEYFTVLKCKQDGWRIDKMIQELARGNDRWLAMLSLAAEGRVFTSFRSFVEAIESRLEEWGFSEEEYKKYTNIPEEIR